MRKWSLEYKLWLAGLVVGILGLLILFMHYFTPFSLYSFQFPCSFYEKTGVYCPGCGGTRAVFAFVEGKIVTSLYYHPAIVYMAVIYLVFLLRGFVTVCSGGKVPFMKVRVGYLYGLAGIVLGQWLIKLIALFGFHNRLLG